MAVRAGVAFSEDGKARGGMGVDMGDFDNTGTSGLVVTNFEREMLGFYRTSVACSGPGAALRVGSPLAPQSRLRDFFFDVDLDGRLDLLVVNGHIDDFTTVRHDVLYAQPPHLFQPRAATGFRGHRRQSGSRVCRAEGRARRGFRRFRSGRDVDVLITTNHGPAYLYRNDQLAGNHSIRFRLIGTRSNRDAIGASVRIDSGGETLSRLVKSGSSYLSQSEPTLTFGLGRRDKVIAPC